MQKPIVLSELFYPGLFLKKRFHKKMAAMLAYWLFLFKFAHVSTYARHSRINELSSPQRMAVLLRRFPQDDRRENLVADHPDQTVHLLRGDEAVVFSKPPAARFRQ